MTSKCKIRRDLSHIRREIDIHVSQNQFTYAYIFRVEPSGPFTRESVTLNVDAKAEKEINITSASVPCNTEGVMSFTVASALTDGAKFGVYGESVYENFPMKYTQIFLAVKMKILSKPFDFFS